MLFDSEHADYLDLIVCENQQYWKQSPASHRYAAQNSSFNFVRDNEDQIVDITVSTTLPSVAALAYQSHFWYRKATYDDIEFDLQSMSLVGQEELAHVFATLNKKQFPPSSEDFHKSDKWDSAEKRDLAALKEDSEAPLPGGAEPKVKAKAKARPKMSHMEKMIKKKAAAARREASTEEEQQ